MTSFLERYQAGECEQVWAELMALGDQVRQEPLLSDAKAVANETMRRVRQNIENIVQRLKAIDYDFESPDDVLSLPSAEVLAQLDAFEREVGPVPLSIRAWCEMVGDVQLLGNYPRLSYYHISPLDPLIGKAIETGRVDAADIRTLMGTISLPPNAPALDDTHLSMLQEDLNQMLTSMQQNLAASPLFGNDRLDKVKKTIRQKSERKQRWTIKKEDQVLSDPLFVGMYELNVGWYRAWLQAREEGEIEEDLFSIAIAPDIDHKSNYSGGGGYNIVLPNPAVDAPLLYESHETAFVNYLRIAFRWGGFPGLEHYKNRDDNLLNYLREDVLPI